MANTILNSSSSNDISTNDKSEQTQEPKEAGEKPDNIEKTEEQSETGKKPKVNVFGKDGLVSSKDQSLGSPFYNLSLVKNVDVINVNIQGMNQSQFDVDDIRDTVLDINVTFSGEDKKTNSGNNGTIFTHKSEWIKCCN